MLMLDLKILNCNLYKQFLNSNQVRILFNNKNRPPKICSRRYFSEVLDVNTNITKDVILYKNDNSRYFKLMNLAAFVQFGFWSYLSVTSYTNLRDVPVDYSKADKWWKKINLGESKYRNGITLCTGLIGWGILALAWIYSLRTVKYLILRKGGKLVTIVTYTPISSNRMFTLNLKNLSAFDSRSTAKKYLGLKVKGHSFYYLVDMNGEFKNTNLFDNTVCIKRNF